MLAVSSLPAESFFFYFLDGMLATVFGKDRKSSADHAMPVYDWMEH